MRIGDSGDASMGVTFYRVHAELEVVEVIHILHGASDYESLLFPDV